jgi:sialate O-acetylesterase
MHSLVRIARLAILLVLVPAAAAAAVQPAIIFCDRMVLQRQAPVPIWGQAAPDEQVTVTFAGQSKQATADARGLWRVTLDAMPASAKPRIATIKGKGDAVTLKDVLVGDVWLFSGDIIGLGYYQGRFQKRSRMGIYYDIRPFIKEDQSAAVRPIIRTFSPIQRGKDRHARHVQYHFDARDQAKWSAYDPANWGGFHAIPYFFGREYFKRIKVPVALVEIGLDDIASMTPPAGFEAAPSTRDLATTVGAWNPTSSTGRTAHLRTLGDVKKWLASTHRSLDAASTKLDDFSQVPRLPGPPPRAIAPTTYYNGSIHPIAPFAIRGMILKTLDKNQYDKRYSDKVDALIRGLRIVMNSPNAPAAFFQFRPPMYWEEGAVDDQSVWMQFRQVQQEVSKAPNTTVLPAHDFVNDPRDPGNWAQRASQWAIATVEKQPVRTGPIYDSHKTGDGAITVRFKQVGRGLIIGDRKMGKPVKPAVDTPLGGFELAGADGLWLPATARISDKSVIVTCKDLPRPVSVRYAWKPRPKQANLYNQAGFCALPFNTHRRSGGK